MNRNKQKQIKAKTVITSHINADFDAVASMLAAQKIYEDSFIIFPGSQEKNLRDFFISSMSYLFNMAGHGAIDFSSVKTLVIVDTKQKKRLEGVGELLDRKDIKIHIYDHHPVSEDDIRSDFQVSRSTGATVTILTRIIREKNIRVTPDEATVMALGIYEDTGLFTYASTSQEDFSEAAYLLSCGANLNTVSSLVVKEIRTEQVTWLNELLNEMVYHKINGFNVYISTISSSEYIPDLASIVQKVVRMEDLDVFFAVVLMGNKISIIARNRLAELDVGRILSNFGGGGHSYAASAKIDSKTLAQVEQQLINVLFQEIKSNLITNELMSSPAITVDLNMSCRKAGRIMTRYNINTLLVTDWKTGRPEGYITRQTVEKALYLDLAHLPVKEYMNSEIDSVLYNASLQDIENRIIEGKQSILPVVDTERVIGVITRSDLLNFLVQHNKNIKHVDRGIKAENQEAKKRNVKNILAQRLDPEVLQILESIGTAGDRLNCSVYVVGGFVRDLLLHREVEDIDIVVEGDGIAFAKEFAAAQGCRVHSYKKFGTAVIIFPDESKIDIASARLEFYRTPAALPTVEMSSIKLDLFRRDFTINTLAIRLNRNHFGTMIDFFGASRDLKDKTIRIIHSLSFVEDPTRVFRAIKFANRFDFSIGKVTSNLIQNAVKIDSFKNLSGLRVFSELKQIFEEENPIPAIRAFQEYGLEKVLHAGLEIDQRTYDLLEEVYKALSWHDLLYTREKYPRWSVYFMALISRCSYNVANEVCLYLKIPLKEKKTVMNRRLKAKEHLSVLEKSIPETNSRLFSLLSVFSTELILFMIASAKDEKVKRAISFYYTRLRDMKLLIKGHDLIDLGLKPGPHFSEVFGKVLDAKLDGEVTSREDEIEYARWYIKSNKLVDME
ncbi:MAG: CBS domain-containing protein [Desulfobacteraceae bacterium]